MPSREKIFTIDALNHVGILAVFLAVAVCVDVAIQFLVGQDLLRRNSVPFYCINALTTIIEICHSILLAAIVIERTLHELRDLFGHRRACNQLPQPSEARFNLESVVQWYKRNPLHEHELVWATALMAAVVMGATAILDQDPQAALLCGFGSSSVFLLLNRWQSRGPMERKATGER